MMTRTTMITFSSQVSAGVPMNRYTLYLYLKGRDPSSVRTLTDVLMKKLADLCRFAIDRKMNKPDFQEYICSQIPFVSNAFEYKNFLMRLYDPAYIRRQVKREAGKVMQHIAIKQYATSIRNRRRRASSVYRRQRLMLAKGMCYTPSITKSNGELFLNLSQLSVFTKRVNSQLNSENGLDINSSNEKGFEAIDSVMLPWLKSEMGRLQQKFLYASPEMRRERMFELQDMQEFRQFRSIQAHNGNEFKLASLEKAFENRFAELYMQTKAMELMARRRNMNWLFITLTCPPSMHPNPKYGRNSYDGTTTKQAVEYLNRKWSSVTRRLSDNDIFLSKNHAFGLKVIEPHQDGCPHAHILLFVRSKDIKKIMELTLKAFDHQEYISGLKVDSESAKYRVNKLFDGLQGNERECALAGSKIKIGNNSMASTKDSSSGATSYLSKYIMKNIGLCDRSIAMLDGDERKVLSVEAWRSCHKIRAFSVIGLKGMVGCWRFLRKVSIKNILNYSGALLKAVLLAKGLMFDLKKGKRAPSFRELNLKPSKRFYEFIELLKEVELEKIIQYTQNKYDELVPKLVKIRINGHNAKLPSLFLKTNFIHFSDNDRRLMISEPRRAYIHNDLHYVAVSAMKFHLYKFKGT